MANVPIVIDGPNFVSRMIEMGIANRFIASQLCMTGLRHFVNQFLAELPNSFGQSDTVEFICSQKHLGPGNKKLTKDEQKLFLDRLMNEIGVHVDQVNIPGSSEKGVDATVQIKLEEFAQENKTVILVSEDMDYIPILHKLRHKSRIITIAIREDFPVELKNESYATVQAGNDYPCFFTYSYPRFDITTFTPNQCAELYANADDRTLNRVSITNSGYVFIARGSQLEQRSLAKVAFEAFCPYNGYVGPLAASTEKYIAGEHQDIINAWEKGHSGILDYRP